MFRNLRMCCGCSVVIMVAGSAAHASLLVRESVSVQSSGGLGGNGSSTSDMIFSQYGNDGWGWAGGAGGVQGNLATTNSDGPANETFKFNVGATIDSLNATYGAGSWTIANPTLTFTSSYASQNNPRFGLGAGTFDIYWVGNDNWAQSKGTSGDRQLNPVYASNATDLATWAGDVSLLRSASFDLGTSGHVNLSYDLSPTSALVNDVVTASASGTNSAVSLYLMATSDTIGMIIFTRGQSQPLPTLSFDVVSVPEPATLSWGCAAAAILLRRRRLGATSVPLHSPLAQPAA